jgi:deoxyribodipyrimidine photo-lyase
MQQRKLHVHPQQPLFVEQPENLENLMQQGFPTNYNTVIEAIKNIDPNKYAKTRNFIWGAITYLSPYISRGFISTQTVKAIIEKKFKLYESEKLIQELAWREFFQRVWQAKGNDILTDIKQPQQQVAHKQIPTAIVKANTTIVGIDTAIKHLYETGYMHNHARMYTAMLSCNIAQSHWLLPAQWLYYHLLDGDVASNMLSWQWVAGSFSSKKYYANQENISKYTNSKQHKGYLAVDYSEFAEMPIPAALQETVALELTTNLPTVAPLQLNNNVPMAIYNTYNIDPQWHKDETMNRVFLLEPEHFKQFPVSDKVLQWMLQLATDNIPNLQIFVGSFAELQQQCSPKQTIYFKEHPTTLHYKGLEESRTWMFDKVTGYYPSFFAFWKQCEKYL